MQPVATAAGLRRIALAGNPNVGKTTLFNLLTGLQQKVANYPGVTVERKSGRLKGRPGVEVIDLPGTYSLNPKSLDERIAYSALTGRLPGENAPDVVVCVVDASNLERNLYLVSQVLDLGLPTVVALNMVDAAEEAGIEVDADALAEALGAPVVPLVARRGEGVEGVLRAIEALPAPPPRPDWHLMPVAETHVSQLAERLAEEQPGVPTRLLRSDALGALTSDVLLDAWRDKAPRFVTAVEAAREALDAQKAPYKQAEMMGRYGWIGALAPRVVTRRAEEAARTRSDRIDAVLTHRVWGLAIFGAFLLLIFQAVFTWATPAMDAIEWGVGALGSGVRALLPAAWYTDLLVDGVVAGVGNVVVFLPQILLLFFFLGLMEDTGYMARTAFLLDRVMRRMGLSGASVVPLLSSYACAIPGIMAARTLPNERDRLITIMVAPLMTCSARLPVYALFIAAFIPIGGLFGLVSYQGLTMLALYAMGTAMAFVAAWILNRFVFRGEGSHFVMELPPYRLPQARYVLRRMVERARLFFVRAGKIIVGISIVLWFLANYPQPDVDTRDASALQTTTDARSVTPEGLDNATLPEGETAEAAPQASSRVRNSYIGRFGRFIEPVMRPLGFDWKISAGLVTAFAAREVIVSALATLYSVEEGDGEPTLLRDALKADRYPDGTPVFTPLVAVSLMVFFVFALQCMSTIAIARRETNTWRWPIVMWLYMFALAYGFSFVVYQGGRLLGLG